MADEQTGRGSWRGLAIASIAVVTVGCGLALAKEVLVPVAIALLLYALLRPLVRRLSRWRIPAPLSAVVVVIGLVALLFGIAAAFTPPLKEWAQRAPETIAKARRKFASVSGNLPFGAMGGSTSGSSSPTGPGGPSRGALTGDAGASEDKPSNGPAGARSNDGDSAAGPAGGGGQTGGAHPARGNVGGGSAGGAGDSSAGSSGGSTGTAGSGSSGGSVGGASSGSAGGGASGGPGGGESKGGGAGGGSSSPLTGILGKVFGTTASLITGAIEVLLLLAFLLAAGDRLRQKVKSAFRGSGDRERAVRVAEEIEAVVSRYVVATALINVGQGVAVGLAMWALGLPTPALWGLLTVVVEFVPYLGALVMVVLLSVAGLATFGNFAHAIAGPAVYVAISTLQNNLVSPIAYGNRLKLSPAVILVAVMLWWFLWGVAGAIVAVPIVAALKVLTEHVPSLKRFTELLSD
ncbi:MAG: hypothetical protein JWM27_1936 [Gemmatimonadetes bacterium]|nr:hypothetical protein [Gemmatimonadota bacterium]